MSSEKRTTFGRVACVLLLAAGGAAANAAQVTVEVAADADAFQSQTSGAVSDYRPAASLLRFSRVGGTDAGYRSVLEFPVPQGANSMATGVTLSFQTVTPEPGTGAGSLLWIQGYTGDGAVAESDFSSTFSPLLGQTSVSGAARIVSVDLNIDRMRSSGLLDGAVIGLLMRERAGGETRFVSAEGGAQGLGAPATLQFTGVPEPGIALGAAFVAFAALFPRGRRARTGHA